jgi:hypothetical protein
MVLDTTTTLGFREAAALRERSIEEADRLSWRRAAALLFAFSGACWLVILVLVMLLLR